MPKHTFLLLCLMLCCLLHCRENFYFESVKTIGQDQWSYADTLDFDFDITDTTALYDIYLDLQHATEYPYQNIYLQVYTRFPSGKRIQERLPIDFADRTGRWFGRCNTEWCRLRVNLQQDAYFNETGTYTITLEQFMRMDPLPGIREVAVRLGDSGRRR